MNRGRSLSTHRVVYGPRQNTRIFYSSNWRDSRICWPSASLTRLHSRPSSPSPQRQIPSRLSLQRYSPSSPSSDSQNPSNLEPSSSLKFPEMDLVNEPQQMMCAPPQNMRHVLSPPPQALPPIPRDWLTEDTALHDLQNSFNNHMQERHPNLLTANSPAKLSLPPAPPFRPPLPPPPPPPPPPSTPPAALQEQQQRFLFFYDSTDSDYSDDHSSSFSETSLTDSSAGGMPEPSEKERQDKTTSSNRPVLDVVLHAKEGDKVILCCGISALRCFLRRYINVPLAATILSETNGLRDSVNLLMNLRAGARRVAELVTVGAAVAGDTNSLCELAEYGVDFDCLPEAASLAMHFAADNGDRDVILELLRGGADPSSANRFGDTVLHRASRAGHTQCVAVLITWGSKLEARNWFGHTPLHEAARWGHTLVVQQLLEAGANFDSVNCLGETPRQLSKLWRPTSI